MIQVYSKRGRYPLNAIYVGKPSKWNNPFILNKYTRFESLKRYIPYLKKCIELGYLDLSELEGQNLVCWCGNWKKGRPFIFCHAVVLMIMANGWNEW